MTTEPEPGPCRAAGKGARRKRRRIVRRSRIGWASGVGLFLIAVTAGADGPTPTTAPPAGPPSAERHFQAGLEAQKQGNWRRAAQEYQEAINQRDAFPEAWNGLGYSLRQQGKYADAIKAYDRALKLRPDYAEALEYLGEAYVKMGKLDEARGVLRRLEPLDKKEAAELQAAIDKAKK
jgi:tetratricopeptide (TPR) repeat protein